jgi:capsid protein
MYKKNKSGILTPVDKGRPVIKNNNDLLSELILSGINNTTEGVFGDSQRHLGWSIVDSLNTQSHTKNMKEIIRKSKVAANTTMGSHILQLRMESVVNDVNVSPSPNRRLLQTLGISNDKIDETIELVNTYMPFLYSDIGVNNKSLQEFLKDVFQTKDLIGSAIISRTISGNKKDVFRSRYQVIPGEMLSNPKNKANGYDSAYNAYIINGIEYNINNEVVAYHIKTSNDKWIRIPYRTKANFINTLYIKNGVGQLAGMPVLNPTVATLLDKLRQYTDAELAAAMLSSLLFGENQTSFGNSDPLELLKTAFSDGLYDIDDNSIIKDYLVNAIGNSTKIQMDGGTNVINTTPFSTFKYYKPEHPNGNFNKYIETLYNEIGIGVGIPFEFLTLRFLSSYSASQTALSVMWQTTTIPQRTGLFNEVCRPVYANFINELNRLGLVEFEFYNLDNAKGKLARQAWSGSAWSGSPQPAIDTLKILKAAEMKLALGVSSPNSIARDLSGKNWEDEVLPEIKSSENAYLDAGLKAVSKIEELFKSNQIEQDVRDKLIDATLKSFVNELTR